MHLVVTVPYLGEFGCAARIDFRAHLDIKPGHSVFRVEVAGTGFIQKQLDFKFETLNYR